jgi:chromosomal replication initiator protein
VDYEIIKEDGLATPEVQGIFTEAIERAKVLDPANSRRWFDQLNVLNLSGGILGIGCPDQAKLQYLQDNCAKVFANAAQQITGHLIGIEFQVVDEPNLIDTAGSSALKLHPDYTFDNFVVGPSNRLVHASCKAVSQSLGNTYNPLFLYGNSGLGKTHLMHAVCKEAQKEFEGIVIELHSCENFVNMFIRAIEEGNLPGFQRQFRTVDLLVIDDVQFLREREHSQEEFFHTFNALYNEGKQIILSADRPPAEIQSIEERLVSRFNWGLVAGIDPPSYETRIAIVQKKSHLRGLDISDEVAEYIARHVQANIRELEGALTTIYALALTEKEPVTLPVAKKALEGQIKLAARHISISHIIDAVTDHFSVRLADMQSKKRTQSIAEPRQICMYLARSLTKHSLEEIGGHLGGRDHTTVMHACSKIGKVKEGDPKMDALLNQLTKQITQAEPA